MKDECGGGAALFQDPDFPCDDASLFSDFSTPLCRLQTKITWRRPQDICQSAALFPDDITLAHAKQGLLGDCWFLCACSVLLNNKHLLNKVLSPDQPQWRDSRYRGSFHFTLWRHGRWVGVTIDDRLPCIDAALCFSGCHSPEAFWVALLEKAYAKLHGSYERLWAGQVSEALVDLTGGLAERWSLARSGSEEDLETGQDSDEVWRRKVDLRSLNPVKQGCALSCSTHSTAAGVRELGQHHALTVMEWLDVKKVAGGQVQLLRIRNPWGRCNWTGAWTGSGAGWSSVDPRCAADLQARLSDGEFWLDEAEFMSHFDDVTLGYPISEEGHLKSIYTGNLLPHRQQQAGQWVLASSAGGSRNSSSYSTNPKFWMKVGERGEVLITLLQHRKWRSSRASPQDGKDTKQQHYQAIALHMWKVEEEPFNLGRMVNKPPCASTHRHAYEREVVLRGQLEPGSYLVIPSTYRPGAQAHFLIRLFSSSPTSLRALNSAAPSRPSTAATEWETRSFRGCWVEGSTAGGSRNFQSHWQNPHFPFPVCDEPAETPPGANVRITLQQSRPDSDLLPIGFHIYKVPEGRGQQEMGGGEEPVASCIPHCYTQDVSLTCALPPARYTVVPSTYHPDCSASFTLSLACRTCRKVLKSQEQLGKAIREISHISVMQS